jgi:hypothetical protein
VSGGSEKSGNKGQREGICYQEKLVKAELMAKNKQKRMYGLGWASFGDIFHTFWRAEVVRSGASKQCTFPAHDHFSTKTSCSLQLSPMKFIILVP